MLLIAATSRNTALTIKLERIVHASRGVFASTLRRSRRWKTRANTLLWLAMVLHAGQGLFMAGLCSVLGRRTASRQYSLDDCTGVLGLTLEYCNCWLE
eukprot:368748-Prymnesium_polylepis.2